MDVDYILDLHVGYFISQKKNIISALLAKFQKCLLKLFVQY